MTTNACPWEQIQGFETPGEYQRFLTYLETQISAGLVEEVPANPQYKTGILTGGRWFKYLETQNIWRLLEPDFPYRGVWELVQDVTDP